MTLTEQWKKGELEIGCYYIKGADGFYGIMSDYELYRVKLEHPDNTISLLAKVPSYEEWQQLHKFLEEFNALDVAKENQQLKELLREAKDIIEWYKADCGYKDIPTEAILTKIDNAIGEKR